MTELLQEHVKEASTLAEVLEGVFKAFHVAGDGKKKSIGYVSGIITSDGPDKIQKNIEVLDGYTAKVRAQREFPIFSAVDVFSNEVFARLNAFELPAESFEDFWRQILNSGWVSHIFMTPRWQESKGATDEYKTAKKLALKIHFIRED
ncbi:MAG: DUF4406 domain-containing protein [bacterium]|nr:DUF4406 domain-containing protein [bacterium]